MNLLEQLKSNGTLPSLIQDPFLKEKIVRIWINGEVGIFDGNWKWYAQVTFKNGKTEGVQSTAKYEIFEEVIAELKSIFESLKG